MSSTKSNNVVNEPESCLKVPKMDMSTYLESRVSINSSRPVTAKSTLHRRNLTKTFDGNPKVRLSGNFASPMGGLLGVVTSSEHTFEDKKMVSKLNTTTIKEIPTLNIKIQPSND